MRAMFSRMSGVTFLKSGLPQIAHSLEVVAGSIGSCRLELPDPRPDGIDDWDLFRRPRGCLIEGRSTQLD